MSQAEIYNIMRSNPNKIFTIFDLIKLVDTNMSTLSMNLKKLRQDKFIKYKSKKVKCRHKYYYWFGND